MTEQAATSVPSLRERVRTYAFHSKLHFPLAFLLATLAHSTSASATPQVNSVEGSIENGANITVQGSDFGTKRHARPLYYAAFGDGNTGTHPTLSRYQMEIPMHSSKVWGGGEIIASDGSVKFDRSGDGRTGGSVNASAPVLIAPGSTHVLRRWLGGGSFTSVGLRVRGTDIPDEELELEGHRLFTFWRVRLHGHGNDIGIGPGSLKLQRMAKEWPGRNFYPAYTSPSGQINFEYDAWTTGSKFQDASGRDRYLTHMPIAGAWKTFWMEHLEADAGVANGLVRFYADGSRLNTDPVSTNVPMRAAGDAGNKNELIRMVDFWQNVRGGETEGQPWYVFSDTMYIDNSLARVMISDQPTFSRQGVSAQGQWEVQVATEWADRDLKFVLRLGPLQSAEQIYLYVFDHDGNVNANGYSLGTCEKCPKPPPAVMIE